MDKAKDKKFAEIRIIRVIRVQSFLLWPSTELC